MRLTKNFTLQEFTRSNTALRLGLSNKPTKEGIIKLRLLATFLQTIRDRLGALRITSGYRSPALSQAIGSSANSQHCRYEAVDLQYVNRGRMDNLRIYQTIVDLDLDLDLIPFKKDFCVVDNFFFFVFLTHLPVLRGFFPSLR